jgi:hypothetical protein
MRKLILAAAFATAVMTASAAPKKTSTPAQLATAFTEIGGLDADQKAKIQAVMETYVDGAKGVKKPGDLKKIDEAAWTELHAIIKPAQWKKVWSYVDRENQKEYKDRMEDLKDRQEDLKDKAEDRKDKNDKKNRTPAEIRKDRAEDKKDKAEDKKDKAEDKKDRQDDAYDTKDEVRAWLNGLKLRVGGMKLTTEKSDSK